MKISVFKEIVAQEVEGLKEKLDRKAPIVLKRESVDDSHYIAVLQDGIHKFHITCPQDEESQSATEEVIEETLKADGFNIRVNRMH